MNGASNEWILLPLAQARNAKRNCDAAEDKAENRNDAEHAEVIRRECMRILVWDDAACRVTSLRQWRWGWDRGAGHKFFAERRHFSRKNFRSLRDFFAERQR